MFYARSSSSFDLYAEVWGNKICLVLNKNLTHFCSSQQLFYIRDVIIAILYSIYLGLTLLSWLTYRNRLLAPHFWIVLVHKKSKYKVYKKKQEIKGYSLIHLFVIGFSRLRPFLKTMYKFQFIEPNLWLVDLQYTILEASKVSNWR